MHITYLILAHKNFAQLRRLVNVLLDQDASFVIHLDKKASLAEYQHHFPPAESQLHLLKKRLHTKWGSYALVQATLEGLKYIQKELPFTKRIVLLSGQDYPIKPLKFIKSFFAAHPQTIFMQYFPIPFKNWEFGGISRFPAYEEFRDELNLHGGSQWMSFPPAVSQIIFEFLRINPGFMTYFKSVRIPDESFFQTLLLSCDEEFVNTHLLNRNLHLIKWDFPFMHPRILTRQYFNVIQRSKALFARKFDQELFPEILDQIDREILKIVPPIPVPSVSKIDKEAVLISGDPHDPNTIALISALQQHQQPFFLSPASNPEDNHLPLFQFFQQQPGCDYYWYLPDQVSLSTREWQVFFAFFRDHDIHSDLVTCQLCQYKDLPCWSGWECLSHPEEIDLPLAIRYRSVHPLYRISKAALKFLQQELTTRWSGHYDMLLPTLLFHAGFRINAISGKGPLVLTQYQKLQLPTIIRTTHLANL